MTTVDEALSALGISEYVLHGEPASEAEFNGMFFKVTGKTAENVAILSSNPSDFGVTWSQITAKQTELDGS